MIEFVKFFKDNKSLQISLVIWIIVSIIVLNQIPYFHFCHDCGAHWDYTKIIVNEHRLPKPNEGWETHQPPLFYLIASLIVPGALNANIASHINSVRILSMIFGAITIIAISWLIQQVTENKIIQAITLLFISTTPKFIFLFTTYNNDSMATMLSTLIILVSYAIYINRFKKLELILLALAVIALYTKLTVLLPIFGVILFACKNILYRKPIEQSQKKIVAILLVALLSIVPYVIYHNRASTGKLFPSLNFTTLPQELHFDVKRSIFRIILPISVIDEYQNKWKDPLAHPWPNIATKKNDYWAFNYITSVYGEHDFNSPSHVVLWIILIIHFLLYAISISKVFQSPLTKACGSLILFAHLSQIAHIIRNPYSCNMDFRYIGWVWIAWAVLYTQALLQKGKWYSKYLIKIVILGVIFHLYFISTVVVR